METAPPTSPGADSKVATPSAPGVLLGIGLGGFLDGIVLHQILQWHHMLTSEGADPDTTIAGLQVNTLADGLFHAFTGSSSYSESGFFGAGQMTGAGRPADVR